MKLIEELSNLRNSELREEVEKRLLEFKDINSKNSKEWFSELCFCLMTANWKAKPAIEIQKELHKEGFYNLSQKDLAEYLRKKGHRFWPQRAERICLAREYLNIKNILQPFSLFQKREWLVSNIKGLGYKESSHFLRNIGYFDLAILDRHILNILNETNYISEVPKTLTKKKYFEIEEILRKIASQLNMSLAELDLYMWYMKTGKILK